MNNKEELAEKLDKFLSDVFPYERYDAVGSFSKEFDFERIGLEEIKESLSNSKEINDILDFLFEVICNDRCMTNRIKALEVFKSVREYQKKF